MEELTPSARIVDGHNPLLPAAQGAGQVQRVAVLFGVSGGKPICR